MDNMALLAVVDLNIIFTVVGILAVIVITALLAVLLVRLIQTVSKVNRMLGNKQEDIEKTIGNLPDLTKNISDVTGEVTKTVATVNGITDQVSGAVSSLFTKKSKGPSPFTAAKKVVEVVKRKKTKKKAE